MPDENDEKVEDFISLWKKKMDSDKNPSVIGDTLNKIKALEKENEELRNKISQNIDLISRSEEIIRKTVEENERLKSERNNAASGSSTRLKELESENLELSNKVKSMVKLLLEKDEEIKTKEDELSRLKATGVSSDSTVNEALINDLRTELAKKTSQISELQSKIIELTEENEVINQQLIEKIKSLPIDYVVPVEQVETPVIKPKPPVSSSQPLEQLCQDLQTELNKYKRVVEKLTKEKSELKELVGEKGLKFDPAEIMNLKSENETLKNELTELQKSLQKEIKTPSQEPSLEIEEKIKELESKLREKDELITQLKLTKLAEEGSGPGPMANLVEELQKNINKLKTTIQEKDQKIKELQK
ncbi:MAG: hypothetical protein ACFE8E_04825 [Candidatus Hodarchaeota archaeon]